MLKRQAAITSNRHSCALAAQQFLFYRQSLWMSTVFSKKCWANQQILSLRQQKETGQAVWPAPFFATFSKTGRSLRLRSLFLFALFALFFVISEIWSARFSLLFTTASLVVTGAAGAFFLGVSRICVLPALIIREGLGARLVSVSAINAAVAAFVVIGYVLILWNGLRGGRRRCW